MVLPGSSAHAARPGGHESTWASLQYSTSSSFDGPLTLAISTRQPRTGGSGTPQQLCNTAEATCDERPPGELATALCRGAHYAGASATVDLGTNVVFAAGNKIYVWGWNTRCEIDCHFESAVGKRRVWRTDGGWQTHGHEGTGLYPLDVCAGARTLVIRGGGHCGSCRIHRGTLFATWAYKGPPFPPDAAPTPPPPWPPTPETVRTSANSAVAVFPVLFLILFCFCPLIDNDCRRRRRRQRALSSSHPAASAHIRSCRPPSDAPQSVVQAVPVAEVQAVPLAEVQAVPVAVPVVQGIVV